MSAPPDWRTLPLDGDGRSLIEASAGTGKTWTISVLYLRLLLEQGLSPRQIVVSTFTNAAAEELRGRVRARLLWALRHAEADALPGDEDSDLAWLRERWADKPLIRRQDATHLNLALAELDLAPIATLHSLCSRILADHPFAAGAAFQSGELVNSDGLLQELADDLWRLLAQDERWALLHQRCRAQYAGKDKTKAGRNGLKRRLACLVAPGTASIDYLDDAAIDAAVPRAWAERIRAVVSVDSHHIGKQTLRENWRLLADYIASRAAGGQFQGKVAVLGGAVNHGTLSAAARRDPEVLEVATFTASITPLLNQLKDNDIRRFWAEAQRWARAQLRERLDAGNQRSFDDLLTTVAEALAPDPGSGTRPLADALHAAWPAALIDEFQDTDPVQYGILDAIYRDAAGTPRGRLVLIGDPKQAIYRFRGGDVHTYERARGQVPESDRLALDTNQRSSPEYVAAVNAFYGMTSGKLGRADSGTTIHYQVVKPSERRAKQPYCDGRADRPCQQPLVIHLLRSNDLDRDSARFQALRVCANQIAGLVSDPAHTIDGERVRPSDIAVLVPSNAQVATLRSLLRERGVPCVATSRSSVFGEPMARELLLLLHAVVHCEDPAVLRAAVATRLWGTGYYALRRLGEDPAAWQAIAARFHAWRALWQSLGLQAVIDSLIDAVAVRHLETTLGERVLTDLRHLGELLQERWECDHGMESLLAWFRDQACGTGDDEDSGDTRAIRIESDARRVQVMTLHASKGLEFPIVYLPLMWAHGAITEKGFPLLSDRDGSGRRVAFTDAEQREVRHDLEDERHRVLYVALTRAVHACHLFALHPDCSAVTGNGTLSALETLFKEGLADRVNDPALTTLRWLTDWQPTDTRHATVPDEPTGDRTPRAMPATPRGPLPARHSFTTLVSAPRKLELDPEQPALDEATDDEPPAGAQPMRDLQQPTLEPPQRDLFAPVLPTATPTRTPHPDLDALLPVAGADFGNAIHAIFEHRQPLVPLATQRDLVHAQLTAFTVRALPHDELTNRLIPRLQTVLDTPLGSPGGPILGALESSDMRAELEFNYALDGASLARIRHAAESAGYTGMVPPGQRQLAGLMNGKIDLVFRQGGRYHVLDYKGNNLATPPGACLEDYAPAALAVKMDAVGYRFQALLYVVALERFLQQRLGSAYDRATHLGDCWYVFIRAVGLELPDGTHCGVWSHRFSNALLDAVQAELSTRAEPEAA